MANTIRIKRRASGGSTGAPNSLANAELAYNESDAGNGILYYGYGTGGTGGTATQCVAIGGDGAFVSLSGSQTISGNKTLTGSITVSGATIDGFTTTGNVTIGGNLTVNGTTTTINSTTVSVDDKNIELAATASPSDSSADGAGITIKGDTDKTFNWLNATDAFTSSEHLELASGKAFYINGASVLNATTLGTGVVSSSLTSVGTIGTGVWQGTTIAIAYGGTGATTASGVRASLSLGDLALQNASNVTITGGTISSATLSGVTFDNVTIDGGSY
jgi:hypothetical protein